MSIRAAVKGLVTGRVSLPADVAHHLLRVLRLAPGSHVVLFDPEAHREGDAVLLDAEGTCEVSELRAVRPSRRIVWLHGMPKGTKMDAIVRDATELGATHVQGVRTDFTVSHPPAERADNKLRRWCKIAEEAARQCERSDPPRVAPPCSFEEAIAWPPTDAVRLCLFERATVPLAEPLEAALRAQRALVFLAGPEGGFSPREITAAENAGWQIVSLGPTILRTETVPAAVLGAVRILEHRQTP